jgi:hypothetical protein
VLDVVANPKEESTMKLVDGVHGTGGFVSPIEAALPQVSVLLDLIEDAVTVPFLVFVPVTHEIVPVLVLVTLLALTCDVPWAVRPGMVAVLKVITCPAPVPVQAEVAAEAIPVVTTCATPNESTGTEHRTIPVINLRNTDSSPFCYFA